MRRNRLSSCGGSTVETLTMAETVTYEKKARDCRDSVESVSLKRHSVLDKIEKNLSELTTRFVEGHEEFCMWEAKVRATWAKDPSKYDPAMHCEIDKIASLWFQCADMLSNLLEWAGNENLEIARSNRAKEIYATMLSVHLMDLSPLPDHLANLAQEAAEKWRKSQEA